MAKFEKGNKLGGRTKGSKNKATEAARLALSAIADKNYSKLEKELGKLSGRDFVESFSKILPYVAPKLTSLQVSGELEVSKIELVIPPPIPHE